MNQCIKCRTECEGQYCSIRCETMKQGKRATYNVEHKQHKEWRLFWNNYFLGTKPIVGTSERTAYDLCENKLLTERYDKKRIN